METETRLKNTGLRGVSVADTKISFIDGRQGVLIYRGYRIEDLTRNSSFEEVACLLLNGVLPRREELDWFTREMVSARPIPRFVVQSFRTWPSTADPMDVLQAAVPLLAMADADLRDETRHADVLRATRILARMPSLMAAWHRLRQGLEVVPGNPELSHGANFLWELHGVKPSDLASKALDTALILQAEHTFNASTFACREVVSTRAHMYAAVAAGVGALSGDLHGGANARVMELLLEFAARGNSEEDVAAWVRERIQRGERIMGMGHPVYKTNDPRAVILKEICRGLSSECAQERLFGLLSSMEGAAVDAFEKKGKPEIKANVDFYSGLLYHMLGIPPDLMTPVFAMALSCGWCAHIIEEKFAEAQPRPVLYRPEADYIGDYCGPIGCEYLLIDDRRS